MDKNQLIGKIQSAAISPELKDELVKMVTEASEADETLVAKVVAKLDKDSEQAFGEITQVGMDAVEEENNQEIKDLEKQGSEFVQQMNKALDQEGMDQARQAIKES